MTDIGHNAADGVAVITPENDETIFHFIQFHIGDWIGGTSGMTPEQEGAYIRFIAHLYQRGKPLPDDDRFMSRVMSLSLRVWKRLKDQLVGLGKIVVRAGSLTNNRFEKERQKRAEEMRKRSAAAQARWAKSRETSPEVGANLAETSGKLQANVAKKASKINDPAVQMDMLTNNQNPITINQEEKTTSTSPAAARVPLDEIEGLNGATLIVQTKLAKWLNPLQPDYRTARQWLSNTVQIFGSEVVKEAFAVMETKMASGDVVAAPLKLMAKICEQKKRERDDRVAQTVAKGDPIAHLSPAAQKRIKEAREKVKAGGSTLWD